MMRFFRKLNSKKSLFYPLSIVEYAPFPLLPPTLTPGSSEIPPNQVIWLSLSYIVPMQSISSSYQAFMAKKQDFLDPFQDW